MAEKRGFVGARIGWAARALLLSLWASPAVAATVVVGQVAPLSGLKAGEGRGYSAGLQLYFDHVNRTGGVNGHTLLLARRDDAGRAEQTVAATQELLADGRPVLLAGYVGADGLQRLQQTGLLARERIALLGYRGGVFTPAALPGSAPVFNVRAGLRDEIARIAEHLATVGVNRLGLVYEDGPDAAALVATTEQALRLHRATLVAKAGTGADASGTAPATRVLLAGNPQAILVIGNGASAAAFIESYRVAGGRARLFTTSDVDLAQIGKRLSEEHMQGLAIAQVTPNPYRVASRLSKEFRDLHAAAGDAAPPVSYAMMEGFIAAKVIAEAVRRASGRLSREGLAAALESIDGLDLGGHTISYRNGQRTGSRFVDLTIISASGRIRQ